jgi:hypothetical protein
MTDYIILKHTDGTIEKIPYDPSIIRKVGKKPIKSTYEQRANAREVLRKLDLI